MNQDFGPFSVDPAQVVSLGGALFQNLISRLLALESASAGMAGSDLHTSYQDNIGDQGVDAGVYAASATTWIPAGDSAWQFKAGDLAPKKCADELEGATRAREIIQAGGKYRIVLGKALEDYLIASREKKLRERAAKLGYNVSGDNFKIIDGNQLARWVEQYPQLAVSSLLRGVGNVAIAFDKWQQSGMHQSTWVPSTDRDELRTTVTAFVADATRLELRIEGVSGLGKTRGVLESLRGSAYEPLVLYVGDADDLNYALIDHLTAQRRSAVLVIDECTRKRHNVFAQQLQSGAQVKLITIGERDTRITQSVPIVLSPLADEVIDKVLTQNRPALWPEARRVVVANCAGNVRWAMYVAEAILNDPKINVGGLIDANTLQLLVGDLLSGDDGFLALSALALFSRYGVDRELRTQIEQIASGLGIAVEDMLAANRKLERIGLITKHGRYRSVTPQPLAVYLATRAWEELGDKIIGDLLPTLDEELAEQLFLRAADLGSSGPAAIALNRILGDDGPFRSLEAISERSGSRLLIQLAIVSPDDVANHLGRLIDEATDDQLRGLKLIRRNLVWTLEKLVWHSATFERAADMLLRLALAENETWSNNATGTWLSLFGSMLPATAAPPDARMQYLQGVAVSSDPAIRKLATQAADTAIDVRGGSVMVSGELQGGVVVEPRGTPKTYGDLWDYLRAGIKMLQALTRDTEAAVREVAEKALIDAIHPMLENEAVRDTLFDALAALPTDALRKVRTEVKHLYALFTNVEKPEFKASTNSEPDVSGRRAGLDMLSARLPAAEPIDELTSLAYAQRWEWEDGELQESIEQVALSMHATDGAAAVITLLSAAQPPEASFELGSALYAVSASDETVASLANLADSGNVAGLVGYLHASIGDAHPDAFDAFLDGPVGSKLDPATRLVITVRGPQSDTGWTRLIELMKVLPVHVGAPRMFGWHVGVDENRIVAIVDEWLTKIETQPDYNFAVDVVAMMVFQRPTLSAGVEARIAALVELRSKFPEAGQQSWDWVQLARRQLADNVDTLLLNLLRQVDAGSLHIFEGSEEQKLIQEAVTTAGTRSLDSVLRLVQTGSWRLQMDFRGWLANVYSAHDVIAWIGTDVERARLVASLTGVADGEPSKVVRFLLDKFGTDDKVSSSLYGDLVSGTWWGNESDRLNKQIAQLDKWIANKNEPAGVKSWARTVIGYLKKRLEVVLVEEAEERR
ncbi:hypothetical protein ACIA5D_51250 [Actinoplanes sp. NPDC051513]|uniref:hypothetical protein n=1 Tax=Actinoplanes sp. NPDC051513 TaxID=3363908 RepID=UPI0037A1BA57